MSGLKKYEQFVNRPKQDVNPSERLPVPEPGSAEMISADYEIKGGITLVRGPGETEPGQVTLELELEPAAPRVVVRPTFKIPNPKQVTESLLIPPLPPQNPSTDAEGAALWEGLPRHVQILASMAPETIPPSRTFEETREQLIIRLLDPILTLEETGKLLDVCPATVRRYANRGHLVHHRTLGQQRRFKLSDVMAFLDKRAAKQQRTRV